jgi:hypothetical protein
MCLRVLAVGFLLAYSLASDLRCVSHPQLEVEFGQQSFEPARVPARLHPHAHPHSLGREIAVKHLRFLTVLQSPFLQFSSLAVHKSNLLEAGR